MTNTRHPNAESTIDTTLAYLDPVLAQLATVVDGVSAAQDDCPTPCVDYPVAQLRDHVVGWLATFAAGFADDAGRAPDQASGTDLNPTGQVCAAAAQLIDAVRAGAAQRPLWLGESSMPGALALQMILWEYQVHGWDLAIATGQPWSPEADGVRASLAFAPGMLTPDFQGEGKPFAHRIEVTADAPALDRLLGLSGRSPNWRPGGQHR